MAEQQPERQQDERPDGDEQQLVLRERLPEDDDRPAEPGRSWAEQVLGAPDLERDILDDEDDAEGGKKLEQLGRRVEAAQQQTLDDETDEGDDERRRDQPCPKAQRRMRQRAGQRVGDERAQHVKRAMREIDDARDAEDERQAGSDEKQRRGAR